MWLVCVIYERTVTRYIHHITALHTTCSELGHPAYLNVCENPYIYRERERERKRERERERERKF